MKIRVTVEGHLFEVEVQDVHARPVVALVQGERFEVWPEGSEARAAGDRGPATNDQADRTPTSAASASSGELSSSAPRPSSVGVVLAPLPGVIASLSVAVGQRVTSGQELLVLEAMKMQNCVRAPCDGVVGALHVTAGQHVRHRDLLLEYTP